MISNSTVNLIPPTVSIGILLATSEEVAPPWFTWVARSAGIEPTITTSRPQLYR